MKGDYQVSMPAKWLVIIIMSVSIFTGCKDQRGVTAGGGAGADIRDLLMSDDLRQVFSERRERLMDTVEEGIHNQLGEFSLGQPL
jgi:hypothetical protein